MTSSKYWWLGVIVLGAAILLHAALPRYEWRAVADHPDALIRVDRWTGRAQAGMLARDDGRWISIATMRERRPADCSASAQAKDVWTAIDCALAEK